MSEHCGGCGTNGRKNLSSEEFDELKEAVKKRSREYYIKYRVELSKMNCSAEELVDRIKSFTGIVAEIEFTEDELIISYDDRLVTESEIEKLIQ